MRTIRHRAAAAAVTALVASLALTACGSGESSAAKDSGGAAASLSAPSPAEQRSTGDDKQQAPTDQISSTVSSKSKTGAGTGNTAGNTAGNKSSNGATTKYTACTGDNTKVKISRVSRPINHLLLTVTNTGNKNCDAYYAPALRFDDAQAVTQIIEDSRPQAVVTLAPGESAYASIALGGPEAPDIPVKQLTVHFMGRDNQGAEGSHSAPLTLPAGTLISDSTSVTYWQADMADALTW